MTGAGGRTGRLIVTCRDRPGIIAAVSRFLHERGVNITHSDQHSTDQRNGHFFLRMEFDAGGDPQALAEPFAREVAGPFGMEWRIVDAAVRKRMAILVSRDEHCLLDLLWRVRRGDLHAEVPLVVSNHPDARADVEGFGVPYAHIPVTRESKPAAEAELLERLAAASVDLIVLARYMQILSGEFLDRAGVPVLNIHHSFLPAFPGADPYARARERGVKIIGATAHYVTEELDEGPIIEQDVVRVSHRHTVDELTGIGRDIERTVLARAVRGHLEDRVLLHGNRTVVF